MLRARDLRFWSAPWPARNYFEMLPQYIRYNLIFLLCDDL